MRPLVLTLLLVTCFSLATSLMPWHQDWSTARGASGGVLAVLLGDSRKIFANHLFEKADVYFHSGFYPSIFDSNKAHQTPHMAGEAGAMEERNEGEETDFMGPPRDWIDRFGRNFFASRHTHLDEGGAKGRDDDHDHHDHHGHDAEKPGEKEREKKEKEKEHHDDEEKSSSTEREILPWLRMSAELDPNRVETYTVSAFWLRIRMKKVKEAEQFLRDGLRANPESYEILFELGRLYNENRNDPERARNIWELAMNRWQKREVSKPAEQQDRFMLSQIIAQLGQLEEKQGNLEKTLYYWQLLKQVSPHPDDIQKEIDRIKAKMAAPAANPAK